MNGIVQKVMEIVVVAGGLCFALLAGGLVWLKAHPIQLQVVFPKSASLPPAQTRANIMLVTVVVFLILTLLCALGK